MPRTRNALTRNAQDPNTRNENPGAKRLIR
jgi:hypothetical protein